MMSITSTIAIDERDIAETFIRASGPGGQHVNKTSSAVELRFDALGSPHLPDFLKTRLKTIAGHRMTRDGIVILTSEIHRSQARNREDALAKLVDLLREASIRRAVRRPTRPTLASKTRRLEGKARRGDVKSGRRSARPDAD